MIIVGILLLLRLVRAIRGAHNAVGSPEARRAIPWAHARRLPRQELRFAIAFTTLATGSVAAILTIASPASIAVPAHAVGLTALVTGILIAGVRLIPAILRRL